MPIMQTSRRYGPHSLVRVLATSRKPHPIIIDLTADENVAKSKRKLLTTADNPTKYVRVDKQKKKQASSVYTEDEYDFVPEALPEFPQDAQPVVARLLRPKRGPFNYYSHVIDLTKDEFDAPVSQFFTRSMSSKAVLPKSPAFIVNLPVELLLMIFGFLKKVPATLLGLTCKKFYYINKDINPATVRLSQSSDNQKLYMSLKEWMGNDLTYAAQYKKFVPVGFWARVLEEKRTTNRLLREQKQKYKVIMERRRAKAAARNARFERQEVARQRVKRFTSESASYQNSFENSSPI